MTKEHSGLVDKPTPQMPDVIYAENKFIGHVWSKENGAYHTSYTRTDLCEELRGALKDCIVAMETISKLEFQYDSKSYWASQYDMEEVKTALTKAQGLL